MTQPPRIHMVILDWLEGELRSGRVRVGDKLPGERLLAERFGISRPSVREAVRVMDAMGLVRTATGSGPNAGATVISEPSAALSWALRMHVATRALPVADIVNTRILLETGAARSAHGPNGVDAARRREVLARAAELWNAMEDPAVAADDFHRLDAEFHMVLSSLSGNVVVETMMASLRAATVGYVQETVADLPDWGEVRVRLQRQHAGILDAFRAADAERAAAALREHILWFYSLVPAPLADEAPPEETHS